MIKNSNLKRIGDHPEIKIISPIPFTLYLRGHFTQLIKILKRDNLRSTQWDQVYWSSRVDLDVPIDKQEGPPWDKTSSLVLPCVFEISFEKKHGYNYDIIIASLSDNPTESGIYEIETTEDWSRDIEAAAKYEQALKLIFPEADVSVDYKSYEVNITTGSGTLKLVDQGYDGTEIRLFDKKGIILRWWNGLME